MFLSAHITGYASAQFVVPEKALHGDRIYLMNADNKLQIESVKILFRSAEGVAIAGNIHEGEQLVLNDLIPAIPGMSLRTAEAKPETVDAVENSQ